MITLCTMEEFFGRRVERIFKLAEHDAERLALHVFPKLLLEIVRRYLRVEVEGTENLPRRGRAIVAPNHSGCMGFDAVILGHVINRETGRIPRILTVWKLIGIIPQFAALARKFGWTEASTGTGVHHLKHNNLVLVFPEGESGSFKPSSRAYQLQRFHTGFVRMAILTRTPIVPCVILGAEETHINLATLRLSKYLGNLILPLPLNVLPLPAKWKIRFLPAIDLSVYRAEDTHDREKMEELASGIQRRIQRELLSALEGREFVYFRPSPSGPDPLP